MSEKATERNELTEAWRVTQTVFQLQDKQQPEKLINYSESQWKSWWPGEGL